MKSEETLFLDNIKPALLLQYVDIKSNKIEKFKNKNFIIKELNKDSSILIIRDEKQLEEKKIGILLGYYPKSVELYKYGEKGLLKEGEYNERAVEDFLFINEFINYNGIQFNVMGLYQ